jgi:hypothetical protein
MNKAGKKYGFLTDKYDTRKFTVYRLTNYMNVTVPAGLPVINSFGVCLCCDVVTW